jgi:hypothetical protein
MFVVAEDILGLESSPQSNRMLRASVYHSLALSDNQLLAELGHHTESPFLACEKNMQE